MKKRIRLHVWCLLAAFVSFACSSTGATIPAHEVVGQQGIIRFIVVSPALAAQDEDLWRITDHL
jgi:hypothetical protein